VAAHAARRYVVIGGGAVGGALAAQLAPLAASSSGDLGLVLVARGEHGRRIAERGLTVRRPTGTEVVELDVVTGPESLQLSTGDVLMLTVKTQDAEAALAQWCWQPVHDGTGEVVGSAADLPIVTFQNGLLTEDLALRRSRRVYGATIAIAASHLTPGEVVSPSLPPAVGAIWLGRYPGGTDALADLVVGDLVDAGFAAWSVDDIAAQKAAKLVGNVGNGLDLLSGSSELKARARDELREEAVAVLRAAGVPLTASAGLDLHGVRFEVLPVEGHVPGRLSTWQSFARGASSEVDHLNGEIVLRARLTGVQAPVNERLQRILSSPELEDRRTVEDLLLPTPDDIAI
jgi:2-dehydropantoate 2-reductase